MGTMHSLEGQQLGNYDITRRIRVGGMGAVYEGRQRTAFDRRVAIKVILGDYANDVDMQRRFAREARTIARLHHPHVLQLIEFGEERGTLYLVMPFIDGGTLTGFLHRALPSLDDVSTIFQQLLDAVEHAHDEGLVHRDIKSSNVLMEERKNGVPYVYLADFGLVRRQPPRPQVGKQIPLDQVPGTPHYMAPEQTLGIVTPLTDIYALGVLLYQMLTGELPYNDEDDVRVIEMHLHNPIPLPSEFDASIPLEIDEVVRHAMAKRPDKRYQHVSELREAFLLAIRGNTGVPLTDPELPLLVSEELPAIAPSVSPIAEKVEEALPIELMPTRQDRLRTDETGLHAGNAEITVDLYERVTLDQRLRPKKVGGPMTDEPLPFAHQVGATRPKRVARRQRRLWLAVGMLVPLLILLLIFFTRTWGGMTLIPINPANTNDLTIYVTAQSKTIQDKYVITASPQITSADVVTHTIPARSLQTSVNDSSTVETEGTNQAPGTQAQGTITFTNGTFTSIKVSPGTIITTASGLKFQVNISSDVTVPARKGTTDGETDVPATAVDIGEKGNVPAHTLDNRCCTNGLRASNPAPFTGGTNAHNDRIVMQSDLDKVQQQLAGGLQEKLNKAIQDKIQNGEVIGGQVLTSIKTTSNVAVGSKADQVQVTVSMEGHVTVYNQNDAEQMAKQLLNKAAIQQLDSNYALQGDIAIVAAPTAETGKDQSLYVNVSAKGQWVYTLSSDLISQWQQALKGNTSKDALTYLTTQPGVQAVDLKLPEGKERLPDEVNQIKIVIVTK